MEVRILPLEPGRLALRHVRPPRPCSSSSASSRFVNGWFRCKSGRGLLDNAAIEQLAERELAKLEIRVHGAAHCSLREHRGSHCTSSSTLDFVQFEKRFPVVAPRAMSAPDPRSTGL